MVNHFEYPQPAAVYLSKLTADSNGDLSMVDTAHVPDNSSRVQGLWFLCRGEKTPWGTHLGAEEYPPDCKILFGGCDRWCSNCSTAELFRTVCFTCREQSP
jgi:hypothetical protein